MGEVVDLLNDNINHQSTAAVELIVGQNVMTAALQQCVGFLEDQIGQLETRLNCVDPPAYAPEVIDLTNDEEDMVVVAEVRKWVSGPLCALSLLDVSTNIRR